MGYASEGQGQGSVFKFGWEHDVDVFCGGSQAHQGVSVPDDERTPLPFVDLLFDGDVRNRFKVLDRFSFFEHGEDNLSNPFGRDEKVANKRKALNNITKKRKVGVCEGLSVPRYGDLSHIPAKVRPLVRLFGDDERGRMLNACFKR